MRERRPGGSPPDGLLQDDECVQVDAAACHDELDRVGPGRGERRRVRDVAVPGGGAGQRDRPLVGPVHVNLHLAARRRAGGHEAERASGRLEARRSTDLRRVLDRAPAVLGIARAGPAGAVREGTVRLLVVGRREQEPVAGSPMLPPSSSGVTGTASCIRGRTGRLPGRADAGVHDEITSVEPPLALAADVADADG